MLQQAEIIQAKETGEAQQATKERDGKMDALDSAMSEFANSSLFDCLPIYPQ